jgi:TolA-binding protein
LSPEKRITKAQMKQDRFMSVTLQSGEYIQKHKNQFIIGAAAVVALILIVIFINYNNKGKNADAVEMLGKAQLAAAMQQSALAVTDYRNIIEQYGSTKVADKACYYLAELYFQQKNYDTASIYFNMFIDKYGKDKMLLASAYGAAGACAEQKQDFTKAGEMFFKGGQTAESELQSPDMFMASGRNYAAAGKLDEAKNAYQQIIDKYKRSANFSNARKKLAEIEYKK